MKVDSPIKIDPATLGGESSATGNLPRVTVVIPAYNAARTLRGAIESALGQDYPDVEVVVVNDGSTDDTAAICKAFGDRIVYVEQVNGGLGQARNAGIVASSGDAITLLDSDDLLGPTCVSSRMRLLRADSRNGLVAGYYREIDGDGQLLPRVPELRTVKGSSFRQAVRRNWGPPVGWTFWRFVYDEVGGFDPLLESCEDWDFVIRVASRYRIAYEPQPLALYRRSAGQMTRDPERALRGQRAVHRKSRAYASGTLLHAVDGAIGSFQHRRRVLYDLLFEHPVGKPAQAIGLLAHHPSMALVGLLSLVTWVTGKRPTAGAAPEVPWYSPPVLDTARESTHPA